MKAFNCSVNSLQVFGWFFAIGRLFGPRFSESTHASPAFGPNGAAVELKV